MYQLLLFITLFSSIKAFWSTPSSPCQPVYTPCRCQRLNSCGYSPSGTGYAMPEERVGGGGGEWRGEEESSFHPRPRITKPRKFVFIWSDEEEEREEERVRVVVPEERSRPRGGYSSSMVIPPTIKRTRPVSKTPEDLLDAAALLELNSAEIEKGRIKTSKSSNDEEDLWTDKETPSKGIVSSTKDTVSSSKATVSKGEDDLWKGGSSKTSDWKNTPSSSSTSLDDQSGLAIGGASRMNVAAMEGGSGGVRGQAGNRGWQNGGGYSGGGGFGGQGAGGSLFGISSGFGVGGIPGIGGIGGGYGFGIGK